MAYLYRYIYLNNLRILICGFHEQRSCSCFLSLGPEIMNRRRKIAVFLFLCCSLFIPRCCVTSAGAKRNPRNHPINTHGDRTPQTASGFTVIRKNKQTLGGGRGSQGVAAQVSLLIRHLSCCKGGGAKHGGEQLTLSGGRRRARPRLSRGEVMRGCGKQAGRAKKRLRSGGGGADETLSLLTGCFQKSENIDLKYL